MFTRNVGGFDRIVRLALGVVLLPLGLFLLDPGHGPGLAATVLGAAGLVSGGLGYCALYVPFGFSTRPAPTTRS